MANWNKILSRGKVQDRRGMAPLAAGGISLTGVVLLLMFNVLTGATPADLLNQLENVPVERQYVNTDQFSGSDSYEVFASTVLGSNNDMWTRMLSQANVTYNEPQLVLFRSTTESSCGAASSQIGPHYCPLDETIYLDETFFSEVADRFGAQGGDVAEAYVISHEVGHHVQNQLGLMEGSGMGMVGNEASIRLELQADCFAGLWAYSIKDQGVFETGELQEAMDMAAAVGDDRIQETTTGYVNQETWTHGSSQMRLEWFNKGLEGGSFSSCNTDSMN